ncbi:MULTISPECIES: hypothetical protein [Halomonadaceae]|uniref:Uncharacterized protein n=1 Tax=Vreelandella titanicae TaxID=664683 RepID=A0A558J6P6_9GAMM|nr:MULTISPECIES: hypothetical protein [Halomonas]MBR9905725.1 hypothetical protein [Gammaproteobacteria bacterium]TVU89202.1 hypothetical protein FQP89_14445 [Halomonas titanicae]CEP36323.1 Putative uncharacterized protein [Halomonas sp. R57-5]
MEWLNDNAQAISAVASICTLFVWVFYAQLLYNGYVRQRRPRVIINRGKGIGVDAICLISNMSSEAIYVQHLVAVLHTQKRSYSLDVVEYQQHGGKHQEADYRTHQGPLASGDYLNIQSFGDIVKQVKDYWEIDDNLLQEQNIQLEIRVIAIYGSEDMPTGASRTFNLDLNASPNHQLIPASVDTDRLNNRGQRKRVLEWAKEIETHKAR